MEQNKKTITVYRVESDFAEGRSHGFYLSRRDAYAHMSRLQSRLNRTSVGVEYTVQVVSTLETEKDADYLINH